jgi:hypothetical protein
MFVVNGKKKICRAPKPSTKENIHCVDKNVWEPGVL